jgi:hypothetical protein
LAIHSAENSAGQRSFRPRASWKAFNTVPIIPPEPLHLTISWACTPPIFHVFPGPFCLRTGLNDATVKSRRIESLEKTVQSEPLTSPSSDGVAGQSTRAEVRLERLVSHAVIA